VKSRIAADRLVRVTAILNDGLKESASEAAVLPKAPYRCSIQDSPVPKFVSGEGFRLISITPADHMTQEDLE
jgi:hypothetical protein